MTLIAFFLVLASAILHAGWNILSKRSNPSAAFYLLSSSTAAVVCLCCAGGFRIDFTLLPLKFSLLLTVSILFEALYLIGLAHAYRSCDISIAYPMGRAMPVLLVAAVTLLLGLGTTPGKIALTGMGILFLGCLLLPQKQFRDLRPSVYCNQAIVFILLIAAGTTGYTVCDSVAMEILHSYAGRTDWQLTFSYLFCIESGIVLALSGFVLLHPAERKEFNRLFLRTPAPMFTGIASTTAYALILAAMQFVTSVTYIQAFRQLSLPIGVFAGVFLLHERCPLPKIVGTALIVAGLFLVAFG